MQLDTIKSRMNSKKGMSRNGNILMATNIYKQIPKTSLNKHGKNKEMYFDSRLDEQINDYVPRSGHVSPLGSELKQHSMHRRDHSTTMDKRQEKLRERHHSTLQTYHGGADNMFSTFTADQQSQYETMMQPDRPKSRSRLEAEQLMQTVASQRDKANNRQKSALMTHAEISSQQMVPQDPYHLDENVRLVPDRWNPTGWKYVKSDPVNEKFFNSPNKINSVGPGYKNNSEASHARSFAKGYRSVLPQRPEPMSPSHKGFDVKAIVNYPKAMPLSSFGKLGHVIAREQSDMKVVDQIKSTYQDFFDKQKQVDVRAWKQRFDNEQMAEEERLNTKKMTTSVSSRTRSIANRYADAGQLITWAGEQHARKDFNKHKDRISDWAQVLYKQGL